jgi:phage terminase large subunit
MPKLELYDNQHDFVYTPHHFAAFLGGIGSGKSVAGAVRALLAAAGHIDGVTVPTPNTGMITAPTYNILRDATLPAFREAAGEDMIVHITTTPPINVMLQNGSYILFRSAQQPELLRGPSLTWWWGDEAALYSRAVWKIMIGRLRQKNRLGYAWLTTTPKGRNWVFQEFMQRRAADLFNGVAPATVETVPAKPNSRYALYRARTHRNPFIDLAYYDALAESYNGDFARQELEGEFLAFEGLVYNEFDRAVHVRVPPRPEGEGQGVRVFDRAVAGVDWGYANAGVIVVFGVDSDGRLWGLHEEYARLRRVEEWTALAAQLAARYAVETFFCDPSEPDFIAQFAQAGVNAMPAVNDVLPGIQAVKNRLVVQGDGLPRLIFSPDFVHTAAEFEQYQWLENRDGLRDAPKKTNDHACDAVRYAVTGVDATVYIPGALSYAE